MTMLKCAVSVTLGAAAFAGVPASAQQRTYINPIDIDYRYNFEQINQGVSYRTGADPAVVNHKASITSSRPSPTATGARPTSSIGPSSRQACGRMGASLPPPWRPTATA
nr:hypothetical protein [uncultured bacterium]